MTTDEYLKQVVQTLEADNRCLRQMKEKLEREVEDLEDEIVGLKMEIFILKDTIND